MQIFNKFRHTKGFITLWQYTLRFRYMITDEAKKRVKMLAFWEQYGLPATQDAFGVSRATLFRWQKALQEKQGRLEALNKQSTAPQHKRKRVIPKAVADLIITERQWEKLGKEKLATLLKEDGVATLSASTVGRMLADLKTAGKLPDQKKLSFYAKSGRFTERPARPKRKKLRSKGHEGSLVKADTIVRFTDGLKRYIVTALETDNKFAFAYGYTSHASKAAADFMGNFRKVAPVSVTHIQTDNGSEFAQHFDVLLAREGIVHFHSYPRSPKMQSEIERFNRTLSEAFITKHKYLLAYDLPAFNRKLMDWLVWYNTRRPHWSLGLKSPLRYIL